MLRSAKESWRATYARPSWAGEVPALVARRVKYRITLDVTINESDLALLRMLGAFTAELDEPAQITMKVLTRELNRSATTVRRSFRRLSSKGLIVKRSSVRDDGGRGVNTYELTDLGLKVLHSEGVMRPQRLSE